MWCSKVAKDRLIVHSDMNCFYASVEMLHNPALKEVPMAVCGSQDKRHGIVLAKNDEARKFGVQTAEPIVSALRKCPNMHIAEPHYEWYQAFSQKANAIYRRHTDRVQPFGIDESWLDLTAVVRDFQDGLALTHQIHAEINDELGLPVSMGVSWNRIFAKLGSDLAERDGIYPIARNDYQKKVWNLSVRSLLFVGPATQDKLERIGIRTIGALANTPPDVLQSLLGKHGMTLQTFALGQDRSPVARWGEGEMIKSVSNSTTPPRDLRTREDVKQVVYMLSESVAERMRQHRVVGNVIQIWLRDTDLCGRDRQVQLPEPTQVSDKIARAALDLFDRHWNEKYPLRSIGVRVTGLVTRKEWQMGFFSDEQERETLETCIDDLRGRFGHWSVRRGISMIDDSLNINPIEENVDHPLPFMQRA